MTGLLLVLHLAMAEESGGDVVVQHTEEAKQAILAKDFAKAEQLFTQVYAELGSSNRVMTNSEISTLWYLRGISAFLQGQDALDYWRQALVINPEQQWDENLSTDESAQDAFWALKKEVLSRKIVSLQIPEQYGRAVLYVDGYERAPADFAYQGEHLAQIQCPQGEVFSVWTNFEKKMKWLKMCPYTFDVTDMPPKEEEDEWGALFGGKSEKPSVNMTNQMVAPPLWDRINKPTLYAAGGTAVAATVLYAMAKSSGSVFADVSGSGITSIDELDAIRSKTNVLAISSLSTGIVSGGLYLYSMSTARIKE